MFSNYIKIALRNLWKNKVFSLINILGIGAAIACSLLLILTAMHQFSYDRFHKHGADIFMLYQEHYFADNTEVTGNACTPLQPVLMDEVPEIKAAIRWRGSGASIEQNGQIYNESIRYTDIHFFESFSFKLLKGNPSTVLKNLNSIVVSEEVAEKLYPGEDPLGKVIKVSSEGMAKDLVISGIVENRPDNSTLHYDIITRFENHPGYVYEKDNWDDYNHTLFVQLNENYSKSGLAQSLKSVAKKYLNTSFENVEREGANPAVGEDLVQFRLMPLYDMYFGNKTISGQGVSRAFPIGLLIIATFILAIACINFVNLTLGSSLSRAKEVGVRKVLGANRRQLLMQFWGEALLVLGISVIVGTALAQVLLPEFNSTFRQNLSLLQPRLFFALSIILIFAGLTGGGYPALVLSRFQAASVLKGSTKMQKPGRLRNVLLVVQFCLSVLLISSTIIVYQQINFLRNKPLGFNKEEVLSIPLGDELEEKVIHRMRDALEGYDDIKGITASYTNLGMGKDNSSSTSIIGFEHEGKLASTHWNRVDYDYFETLEIPLVAGRAFSREHPSDSSIAVIINETFAKELGNDPIVGTQLGINEGKPHTVIGVMKDYHFKSLSDEIASLSIILGDPDFRLSYIFIRVNAANVPATMDYIQNAWEKINPSALFQASFLDENADRLYRLEKMMGKLFFSASALAILLSCMGLFGVVLMVLSQRTKEIGIRKVLGASVANIIGLISKDFLIMMFIAILVATPVAWYGMNQWLSNYAYGVEVQWWVFILAGALAIFIALSTISLQSIKAALANPVKALKDE